MSPIASLVVACSALLTPAPDTVVVSPPAFLETLRPWIAHRVEQGHRFAFVSNSGTAQQIRTEIREHAAGGNLRFIVLVGDAEPAALFDPAIRARCIPAYMIRAKVNVRYRSTPELATDNWYADLDDDGVPDVAIGRLPADTTAELGTMIHKILSYETQRCPGPWRQRINFVAGIGGFGPLIDPIIEIATKKFLTEGIPAEYDTSMTYGNWRSPFCPSPYYFHSATVGRLNEGCLFWVYVGHGYPYELDRVHVPGGSFHILNTADMPKLDNQHGAPIAIFLACYTGAYDQPYDCLAEQMLRTPGGPVAALAGSRVMMPYAMAVFGSGLMDEYFGQKPATLGEVILNAKRRLASDEPRGLSRRLLDLVGAAISPDPQLMAEERHEHLSLFNLFGDPLMRVVYPDSVMLDLPSTATAGSYLEIRGHGPCAGRCTIELVCRRDQFRHNPPNRRRYDGSLSAQTAFNSIYAAANDHRWSVRHVDVESGSFLTAIKIPPSAKGACHVRVFLESDESRQFALGSADIQITPADSDSAPVHASLEDHLEESEVPRTAAGRLSDIHR